MPCAHRRWSSFLIGSFLGALLPAPGPAWAQGTVVPDTTEGVRQAIQLLREYYNAPQLGSNVPRSQLDEWDRVDIFRDSYCDGGKGALCHGGDPDKGPCRDGASCHPSPEFLTEGLAGLALAYPSSEFVLGQSVYTLVKFRQTTRAAVLADQCEATSWFCDALRGYVLQAQGDSQEAYPFLVRAMAEAPIPERCAYGNAFWLLGDWAQKTGRPFLLPDIWEKTRDMPCLDRLEISDTLFWWADPLYSVEGNERWVEHIARALSLRFYEEGRGSWSQSRIPQERIELDWADRIRRGVWDSYENPQGRAFATWTSEEKARYHFLPQVDPVTFARPSWDLVADLWDEGFTPGYGPFLPVPTQVARFRAGDSLLLAVAGSLAGTPLDGAPGSSTNLILTDGPGSLRLHLSGTPFRDRAIFLGQAPSRDYVLSLEILSGQGIGWHRESVSPLRSEGSALSDLLLYRPVPDSDPDSLLAAAALMLGGTTVSRQDGLGVYWEAYATPLGESLSLELSIRRASAGVMDRLSRFIPGRSQDAYGPVRWTEEASGETHVGRVSLDISELDPGEHVLILRVEWEGQEALERQRSFIVG